MSKYSALTRALHASVSGIKAQDDRLVVIAQNLANAHVRPSAPGELPYQRKTIKFSSFFDKDLNVHVISSKKVEKDTAPFEKVFSPGDPAADARGYVLESNVNPLVEFADMRESSRAHEANVRAFEKILHMIQNTIGILKA